MKRKDFLFSLIAAPIAFVAGVRSYRGVPPIGVPRGEKYVSRFGKADLIPHRIVPLAVDLFPSGPYPSFRSLKGVSESSMYFEWRTDR